MEIGWGEWLCAPQSGILHSLIPLCKIVEKAQIIVVVAEPFGEKEEEVIATASGIVVGRTNFPLVNEGEALFHIARCKETDTATDCVEVFRQEMDPDSDPKLPSEPPIF